MKKQIGIKCNQCNDVLLNNRECFCKQIAVSIKNNIYNLFCDSENEFEIVECYIDDNERIIKILDTYLKNVGKDIILPEEIV